MKNTGIVKRGIDDLGRITLPKKLEKSTNVLDVNIGDDGLSLL